jgi:hypothetical protein
LEANGTRYRVVVSNSGGSVTSTAAELTVVAIAAAPAFTLQPLAASVTTPNAATFTVEVSGQPNPTLQWQRSNNGGSSFVDLAGATGNSYSTGATALSDNGAIFRVVATNSAGSVTSAAVGLNVAAAPAAPIVTEQPQDVRVVAGQVATLSVTVSGTPAPNLQWQLSSNGGASFSNINGATGRSYSLQTSLADNGNQYRVVATNSVGSANSRAALLTVQAPASGLEGRAWVQGNRFNPNSELVVDQRGAEPVSAMDSAGRLVTIYASATLSPVQFKIWAVVSTPGTATVPANYGTPVLLASSSAALLPSNVWQTANGGAVAAWIESFPCVADPRETCTRVMSSSFDAVPARWTTAAPMPAGELALLNGKSNEVGDQIGLLGNGSSSLTAGFNLAWRQRGRSDIETLLLDLGGNLSSIPVAVSLDNDGSFVVVYGTANLDGTQNVAARRGSIRTKTLGPEELLETRSAPASIDGVWSNASGRTVVMWNQNNGTQVTEFAATLDSHTGAWNVVDTGLPSQRSLSHRGALTADGDFHWYSFASCRGLRRVAGTWSPPSQLPSDLCANSPGYQAVAENGNVLAIDARIGRWATFDARRQAMVSRLIDSSVTSGPGYVLGTRWNSLPGTALLSNSGVGGFVSVNAFDALPTAASPNGDSRGSTFKSVWGLYLK